MRMRPKPNVIVINETLARKYFPGEDPIGQKIGNGALDAKSIREIVGVVADVREGALDNEIWPAEYEALYQKPDSAFAIAVRTAQDEKSIVAAAGEYVATGRSESRRVWRSRPCSSRWIRPRRR